MRKENEKRVCYTGPSEQQRMGVRERDWVGNDIIQEEEEVDEERRGGSNGQPVEVQRFKLSIMYLFVFCFN